MWLLYINVWDSCVVTFQGEPPHSTTWSEDFLEIESIEENRLVRIFVLGQGDVQKSRETVGDAETFLVGSANCSLLGYCLTTRFQKVYHLSSIIKVLCKTSTGLIWIKEERWTGFSKWWQGCSEGFPEGKSQGTSRGTALPAQGKLCPSQLFYSNFL